MATSTHRESSTDLPLPEQEFVDSAYERLDALRASYRDRQGRVHSTHGVGNAQGWTEREALSAHLGEMAARLEGVEERLVFGRLDMADRSTRHVGRLSLSHEDGTPLLVDWRAPAARPFYQATSAEPDGVVRRRHISTRDRRVTGLEDELLDASRASGLELQGEGALMHALSEARDGRMGDIVATIQSEQDRIIRASDKGLLVVQGGPGTGKTAVALHRAAYLLYTHRRTLERSGVLVVGPSSAFLHYIDQVLPSLGETGVVSRTISDLIPGITATAVDSPYAAKLKGDRRMTSVVANAIAARVRVPAALPTVTISGIQVPMLATDIEQAQADAKRTRQPHNKARETFIRSMLTSMQNRYAEQLDYTPDQAELNRAMSLLRMNEQVRKTLNLCWLPMTAPWLIDQLFAHPERLKSLAGWLTDNDIAALARPKGSPLTRSDIPLLDEAMDMLGPDPKAVARQSAADARRAAEEQYAKDTLAATGLGGGIVSSQMLLDQMNGDDAELTAQRAAADREWTYGHIVVDEAQELTAMDWRMLIRRCPSRSFTIVGDVAQTSALGGTRRWSKSMNRLFGESHWDLNELTINYRNPQEVSELASRFAEEEGLYISTVNAVRTIPDSVSRNVVPDMSSLLETTAEQAAQLAEQFVSADGTGRIAVICPDNLIAPVRDAVRRKLAVILDPAEYARLIEQPEWDEQISVCGTETVKGLEFDAVVVVEPGLIEDDAPSRLVAASDLYVAMTRPTQKLVIVRTKADEKSLNI